MTDYSISDSGLPLPLCKRLQLPGFDKVAVLCIFSSVYTTQTLLCFRIYIKLSSSGLLGVIPFHMSYGFQLKICRITVICISFWCQPLENHYVCCFCLPTLKFRKITINVRLHGIPSIYSVAYCIADSV